MIKLFPETNRNNGTYSFSADYADRNGIEEVIFLRHAVFETIRSEIFSNFPNLESLRVDRNLRELNSGDFNNARNLTVLNLSFNKLKMIRRNVFSPAAKMAQSAEHPSEGAAFPLHKLKTLNLKINLISEIEANSFDGLNSLFDLDLQSNKLTTIYRHTFVGLPSLHILDLQFNNIESIEDGAFDLPALSRLVFNDNKLKRLSDVVFDRLPKLETIILDANELEQIGRALYKLPSAEDISLMWNRIQDIDLVEFAELPHLNKLMLIQSGFTFENTKIEDERDWSSPLTQLHIGQNNLTDDTELIKLRIFPRLTTLDLDYNRFSELRIGSNRTLKDIVPSLSTLYLGRMKMSREYFQAIESKLKAENVDVIYATHLEN